jgi:hypothetical protein
MGIEPTNHMISMRLNGFEDRGLHQQSKHFQIEIPNVVARTNFDLTQRPRYILAFSTAQSNFPRTVDSSEARKVGCARYSEYNRWLVHFLRIPRVSLQSITALIMGRENARESGQGTYLNGHVEPTESGFCDLLSKPDGRLAVDSGASNVSI